MPLQQATPAPAVCARDSGADRSLQRQPDQRGHSVGLSARVIAGSQGIPWRMEGRPLPPARPFWAGPYLPPPRVTVQRPPWLPTAGRTKPALPGLALPHRPALHTSVLCPPQAAVQGH